MSAVKLTDAEAAEVYGALEELLLADGIPVPPQASIVRAACIGNVHYVVAALQASGFRVIRAPRAVQ